MSETNRDLVMNELFKDFMGKINGTGGMKPTEAFNISLTIIKETIMSCTNDEFKTGETVGKIHKILDDLLMGAQK